MASIETVVNVQITKGTRQVPLAGFGVGLIMDQFSNFVERFRVYGSFTDVAADFTSSDDVYKAAQAYFSQDVKPTSLIVGRQLSYVAQVATVSVATVADNFAYEVTINGTLITFTSDGSATGAEIQAGLIAAINASAQASKVTATAGAGSDVVVTSDTAGLAFSITVGTNLTVAATTANHGPAEDIAEISALNNDWYGLMMLDHTQSLVLEAAAYIETQKKIFITSSQDSGVIASSTTDVAYALKALNYSRTACLYSAEANSKWPEAAWIGRLFPTGVGSSTWKFKTLAGIDSDNLSGTAISNAQGKNCNVYVPVGGVDITEEGKMASGEFIDIERFIDWLVATMEANVYSLLINSDKVPYTNKGIATVENAVRSTLDQGVANGGLATDPAYTVTVPDVLDVPSADKASRTLNGVVFTATLAGAIHKVNIQGFVSV